MENQNSSKKKNTIQANTYKLEITQIRILLTQLSPETSYLHRTPTDRSTQPLHCPYDEERLGVINTIITKNLDYEMKL